MVQAVESVTRRDGESYDDFVRRAADNPIGRRVKLADLADNCDLSRIAAPTSGDRARVEKYRRAMAVLLAAGAAAQPSQPAGRPPAP